MTDDTINQVVHSKSRNERDVKVVQRLLNANISKLTPLSPLKVDGKMGPNTANAIIEFQKRVVGMRQPDGRVDPGGRTLTALRNVPTVPSSGKKPAAASTNPHDVLIVFKHHNRIPKNTAGMTSTYGKVYEADVTVSGGVTGSFTGSIWPDSMIAHKRILDGTYPLHIGFHQGSNPSIEHLVVETRKKPRAALLVNCRNPIPATNSENKSLTAKGVNVHNGWVNSRGSEACLTIAPGDWSSFITLFLNAYPNLSDWTKLGDRTGIKIGSIEVKA